MKLYVMRHGHSPSTAESGVASDADRPLSVQGREDARAQARALTQSGGKPALILHSPLRRAVETAAEVSSTLGASARAFPPLSNQLGAEDLAQALAQPLAAAGELLIVGHQPQVGELSAWLVGRLLDFQPASLAALELDGSLSAGAARLLWTGNPEA